MWTRHVAQESKFLHVQKCSCILVVNYSLQNHSIFWVYEHLLFYLIEITEVLEATGSRELEEMLIKTNLKGLMIKILIN